MSAKNERKFALVLVSFWIRSRSRSWNWKMVALSLALYKRVESEVFEVFPEEVTETSFATNCDHSIQRIKELRTIITKFARLNLWKSIKILPYFFRFSEVPVTKIQALILYIVSPKNVELLDGSKSCILILLSFCHHVNSMKELIMLQIVAIIWI